MAWFFWFLAIHVTIRRNLDLRTDDRNNIIVKTILCFIRSNYFLTLHPQVDLVSFAKCRSAFILPPFSFCTLFSHTGSAFRRDWEKLVRVGRPSWAEGHNRIQESRTPKGNISNPDQRYPVLQKSFVRGFRQNVPCAAQLVVARSGFAIHHLGSGPGSGQPY